MKVSNSKFVGKMRKVSRIFLMIPLLSGCAAVAVTGAGGVAYTISQIAFKTISYPIAEVDKATIKALKKMDIKIIDRSETEKGLRIKSATKELDIFIDLEKVTSRATRIHVDARKGRVFKDKATATGIINQVEEILEKGRG